MTIRPATKADLPAVVGLERQIATAPHWTPQVYLQLLADGEPRRCLLIAEESGLLVGFAVGLVLAGVGELESVAVAESARRLGVGSGLCRAVMAWCREQGATEMELEVRASSTGAIRVYQRLGFVETGRRPRYYADPADDALLMRSPLESPL